VFGIRAIRSDETLRYPPRLDLAIMQQQHPRGQRPFVASSSSPSLIQSIHALKGIEATCRENGSKKNG
jgi:hypothetical protein